MLYSKSLKSKDYFSNLRGIVTLLVLVSIMSTRLNSQVEVMASQSTTTQIGIDRLADQSNNESYQHLFVPELCDNINFTLQSILVEVDINSITHPNNPDCAGLDIQALYFLPNNCGFNQNCDIQGQILSERCANLDPAATAPGSFSLEITNCPGNLEAFRANPVVPIDIVPVTPNTNSGAGNACSFNNAAITDGWVAIDYTITVTWTFLAGQCDDGDPCTVDTVTGTGANCACVNTFADDDGDGVCDGLDACPGFDDNADSDSDSIPDGCDNCPNMDNANQSDFDRDGVGNACDPDDDNDGIPDDVDCAPLDASVTTAVGDTCDDGDATTINDVLDVSCNCAGERDQDGDGVANSADNCPSVANADQLDFDSDGIGDACDNDDDNDGVPDSIDCEPLDSSQDFASGDACDDGDINTTNDTIDANCNCIGTIDDTDGDGIPDPTDNCLNTTNADQLDFDNDGMGDLCDDDDDDDGVLDDVDCEPLDPNITAVSGDSCDDGDTSTINDIIDASCACVGEPDQDNDGIADAVDNCPATPNPDQDDFDNDGMGDVCDDDDDDDGVLDNVDCDPLDPIITTVPGDSCDDGDPSTINDIIDASCACVGEPDQDGDGIADAVDNCPATPNPDQDDFDNDGMGDVCDDDDDDDGVLDNVDCDPLDPNNTAVPGDSCDDGDPSTINDIIDASCACVGEPDQDGDGIADAVDNCPATPNPDQDDFDNDGMGDVCDDDDDDDGVLDNVDCDPLDPIITTVPGDSCDDGDPSTINDIIDASCACVGEPDQDGDGIADAVDNCPATPNPDQDDFDNDGMGDVCDDDDDDDGVLDTVDCDPMDATVNFAPGDACDDGDAATMNDVINTACMCIGAEGDQDGDGIPDTTDNCPATPNPDQDDSDGDGMGDICDDDDDDDGVLDDVDCDPLDPVINFAPGDTCDDGDANTMNDVINTNCMCIGAEEDMDGDGIIDSADNCPTTPNPDQDDFDSDGMGDACDDDDDDDGVLDDVDCDPLDPVINFAPGDTCDDGDSNTMNDIISTDCMCVGADGDMDGDGTPDTADNCPATSNPDQDDSDGDGMGDACDDDDDDDGVLDNVDCDPLDASINVAIGDICDDGDPCTVTDTIDMDCNCFGTFSDTDGDGVCDGEDQCTGSDDNVDEDNNGITDGCENCTVGGPCDDGDDCTTDDTFDMDCNCIGNALDCSNGVILQMPCDDGNPNTDNDTEFFLECTGEICQPCIGIPQTIEEDLFYIPTAFSPNGDGVNDRYTISFREQVLSIELFNIYDRYGGVIFSLNNVDPNQMGLGWDGTFDRQEAPTGVYVYVLRVIAIDGSTVTEEGTLTLTR